MTDDHSSRAILVYLDISSLFVGGLAPMLKPAVLLRLSLSGPRLERVYL